MRRHDSGSMPLAGARPATAPPDRTMRPPTIQAVATTGIQLMSLVSASIPPMITATPVMADSPNARWSRWPAAAQPAVKVKNYFAVLFLALPPRGGYRVLNHAVSSGCTRF